MCVITYTLFIPNTCDKDLCQWGWLGEWWLFELPEEELFNELMEHMDDFLEPKLDGDEGGVWNDQPLSELFKSAITCSEAGGKICGSAVCLSSCCTTSWRRDNSESIPISSSCIKTSVKKMWRLLIRISVK